MLALLPLLSKRIDDLTLVDLGKIRDQFNLDVEVTEEMRAAGIAILKGEGIDKVADAIQSPEAIQSLLSMFSKKQKEQPRGSVVACPHCNLFFVHNF